MVHTAQLTKCNVYAHNFSFSHRREWRNIVICGGEVWIFNCTFSIHFNKKNVKIYLNIETSLNELSWHLQISFSVRQIILHSFSEAKKLVLARFIRLVSFSLDAFWACEFCRFFLVCDSIISVHSNKSQWWAWGVQRDWEYAY